jgi:hypothetical protein
MEMKVRGWGKIVYFKKALLSRINETKKIIFGESLKNEKPIEKSKFENLVTLLQLTPLV